jgi:hypothetical protein
VEPSGEFYNGGKACKPNNAIKQYALTSLLFVIFRANSLCTRLKIVAITCMMFSGLLFILLCLQLLMDLEDLIFGILTMIRRYCTPYTTVS